MDLSCPQTIRIEIYHKCRETIPLVQVCFRFELSLTVLKLLSKSESTHEILTKFSLFLAIFSARWRQKNFKNYRIIQTTPEYTIPENLVRIGRVVSENER